MPFSASPFQDQDQGAQAGREPGGHVPVEALVARALQCHLRHRYGRRTGPTRSACLPGGVVGGGRCGPPAPGSLSPDFLMGTHCEGTGVGVLLLPGAAPDHSPAWRPAACAGRPHTPWSAVLCVACR